MTDVTMPASELARVMNDVNAIATELGQAEVDWGQLYHLVPQVMEIVETVEVLGGDQKKDLCISLFDTLLDKINLPGPNFIIKPIIKAGLPWVIDIIVKASDGAYKINVAGTTDAPKTTIAPGDVKVPVAPPTSQA